ncbi:ATP-binding cassette domain-containing protein, partial [Streptococcus agalactiae]
MIKFEHVSKVYGEKEALSDLTLSIKDGEIFGLIGHNGAGKTTTISILT